MPTVQGGFDWGFVNEAVEAVLGKGTFYLDPDANSGMIIRKQTLLAIVVKGSRKDCLAISFRSSVLPNTATMLSCQLAVKLKIELDPYFEFDHNGDMLIGPQAIRFFAQNAELLLLGERKPSKDSTKVRPKGPYTKHNFN